MGEESIQDRYAPKSVCFGCGPANEKGLRIKSRVESGEVVCDWKPREYHHAFAGFLNGGIAGTILDCHSNWAAAYALMEASGATEPPSTVTSEFNLKFLRPTPMDVTLHLRSRIIELGQGGATVETTLEAAGRPTAVFKGKFVVVREGHPAFGRWRK
jgi:acyl-coenzyme A thioesterase PaaI-like protein